MHEQDATRAQQLTAQLVAAGLEAEADRLAGLLPGYQNLLAGVERIASVDLTGIEPGFVLALPGTEPPTPEPRR